MAINRDEATVAQAVDSSLVGESARTWPESAGDAQAVASPMPGSWNHIVAWLKQIDAVRQAA